MNLFNIAHEIGELLLKENEVKTYHIYGSLATNSYDQYSDIDLEIDVSDFDNSLFIQQIPTILSKKYSVIFSDYAPSLAPNTYLVSVAISEKNPFLIVDVKCSASARYEILSKENFRKMSDYYQHILKLFVANLKHYLRQQNCRNDVLKMAQKIDLKDAPLLDDLSLLHQTFKWLTNHGNNHYNTYLKHLKSYIPNLEH